MSKPEPSLIPGELYNLQIILISRLIINYYYYETPKVPTDFWLRKSQVISMFKSSRDKFEKSCFLSSLNWLNNGVDLGCKASKNYMLPGANDLIFNVVYINTIALRETQKWYHFTDDWMGSYSCIAPRTVLSF